MSTMIFKLSTQRPSRAVRPGISKPSIYVGCLLALHLACYADASITPDPTLLGTSPDLEGNFSNPFKDWLPSRVASSLLPASKGEVQREYATKAELQQQNLIINQLIKQVNALTPGFNGTMASMDRMELLEPQASASQDQPEPQARQAPPETQAPQVPPEPRASLEPQGSRETQDRQVPPEPQGTQETQDRQAPPEPQVPPELQAQQTFTAPRPGNYYFTVAGAQGGTTLLTTAPYGSLGGLGATVTANVSLQQGAAVLVIVGGQGAPGDVDPPGAGGGGLSALYTDPNVDAPSVVAGGGGGGAGAAIGVLNGDPSVVCDAFPATPAAGGAAGAGLMGTGTDGSPGNGGNGGGKGGGGGGGTVASSSSTYPGGIGEVARGLSGGDGGFGAGGGGGDGDGVYGGGGGGAGYVGGAGGSGTDPANPFGGTAAGAGTSFLDASVPGTCQGLAGNSGNGYVNVYLFL